MKRPVIRLLAVCLALTCLLSGCGIIDVGGYFRGVRDLFFGSEPVAFSEMDYVRPDMDSIRQTLDVCCATAATETDLSALTRSIRQYYTAYDEFHTAYMLSYLHYSHDLTDTRWEAEYQFCSQNSTVLSSGLDRLYRTLAESPLRDELETEDYFGEGYFDRYSGETIWDDTFTGLMNREAELENQYYTLSSDTQQRVYGADDTFTAYGTQLAQLYVELVRLRQEIAAQAGYESYADFIYDFGFDRDYTPAQMEDYLKKIQTDLAPLYRELFESGANVQPTARCTQSQTYSYVRQCAQKMGGVIEEAFSLLDEAELYDIAPGETKYNGSFEVYLLSYGEPFIFLNPQGTVSDKLTFAHEFGHFCSDYAAGGSIAGTDVAEVFSQGMEYLSLCYGTNVKELTRLKLADCLCVYVEQAAYATFEQEVYRLAPEALNVETVQSLYERTCIAFSLDRRGWDSREFVLIPHFFTEPMYIASYVVSNDAALQLYQMELERSGAGLECLSRELSTEQAQFLAFLEEAGLESPFSAGRIRDVVLTLHGALF